MERMLVREYLNRLPDDQRQETQKAFVGMYLMELMRKANLPPVIKGDYINTSLLATECIDHGEYVTLAPDWENDLIVQWYGGRNELPMAAKM